MTEQSQPHPSDAPHQANGSTRNSFRAFFMELFAQLGVLIRAGNRRHLVLKNAEQRTLLRVPLTLAVILGLFLVFRAAVLLVIAVIVALFLKVQFFITTDPAQPVNEG